MKALKKVHLVSWIVTLILMLGSIGLATWALIRTNLEVGGNISFTGTGDILATISEGSVIGGELTNDGTGDSKKMQQIDIAADYTEEASQVKLNSWKGLEVSVPEDGSDVIINFTITNNSADKALQVSLTSSFTSAENMTMKVLANGAEMTGPENINMQACQHFQLYFKVTDNRFAASMNGFKATFDLVNTEGLPASGTDVLSFTETEGGYSVSLLDASTASGTIVIPATYNDLPVVEIGDFSFAENITSVIIPISVTSLYVESIEGCTGLTSITIPTSVTFIDEIAFAGCTGLTSLIIPSSVTNIVDNAFHGCNFNLMIVEKGNSVYHSAGNCIIETESKTLISGCKTSVIPTDGSVTSIGTFAFANLNDSFLLEIPSTITSIGKFAFYGCSGLTSVTFEDTAGWWVSKSSTATSGTNISSASLANKTTAATYLRSTYYNYYWKKG